MPPRMTHPWFSYDTSSPKQCPLWLSSVPALADSALANVHVQVLQCTNKQTNRRYCLYCRADNNNNNTIHTNLSYKHTVYMYMYMHIGASPKTVYGKYEEKRGEREGERERGKRLGRKRREGGRERKSEETGERKRREGGRRERLGRERGEREGERERGKRLSPLRAS